MLIRNHSKVQIGLIFQDYKHPIYAQNGNNKDFISHLSILDLIMNMIIKM